jgi:hypothetical protein
VKTRIVQQAVNFEKAKEYERKGLARWERLELYYKKKPYYSPE